MELYKITSILKEVFIKLYINISLHNNPLNTYMHKFTAREIDQTGRGESETTMLGWFRKGKNVEDDYRPICFVRVH